MFLDSCIRRRTRDDMVNEFTAKEQTHIARAVEIADVNARYDAEVKLLLSDRRLLAWIMKYTVSELMDYDIETIMGCIEGEPEVSVTSVYPGMSRVNSEKITGMSTEEKIPNEGGITYDIRFYVITPEREQVKLIVNVEAQKKFYPGYDLVTRGVFYCARMLSAQLDTEFTADNYDGIKKVYGFAMNREVDGRMTGMCNLSELIEERALERGIETGIERGIERGRAEEIVESSMEFGLSESEILERLQSKLNIPLNAAREYFEMYG